MENKRKELENRLVRFSVAAVRFAESLPATPFGNRLKDQICRSATSVPLNFAEARSAESKKDFIHKIKICLKELRETHAALRIADAYFIEKGSERVPERLMDECNQLVSIFVASAHTAQYGRREQAK